MIRIPIHGNPGSLKIFNDAYLLKINVQVSFQFNLEFTLKIIFIGSEHDCL